MIKLYASNLIIIKFCSTNLIKFCATFSIKLIKICAEFLIKFCATFSIKLIKFCATFLISSALFADRQSFVFWIWDRALIDKFRHSAAEALSDCVNQIKKLRRLYQNLSAEFNLKRSAEFYQKRSADFIKFLSKT